MKLEEISLPLFVWAGIATVLCLVMAWAFT